MSSLLSEPKVVPAPQLELVSGEQKVAMASKASRLLKTVKLMLAREKSYNVSSAEGRKRGRKQNKSAYSHRCSGSPCLCCSQSVVTGTVLRTSVECSEDRMEDKIDILEKETDTAASDNNKKFYLSKQDRLCDAKVETNPDETNKMTSHYKKSPTEYLQVKKKKSLSRQSSQGSLFSSNYDQQEQENCVMCLHEKEMEGKKCSKTRTTSIEQRIHNKENGLDNSLHRSKSDAQEKILNEKEVNENVKTKSSSKFIKRSRSFHRIFSYSMLNRSKEYRL